MDDFYNYNRQLYLDYLSAEIVTDHHGRTQGKRPRVRKIGVWEKFTPILKHNTAIDLDKTVDIATKNGPQVWIWSDQHFGHKNILEFSNRPYPTLDLMHECMVLNHNDYVEHGDISIWVGDVAFLNDNAANEIIRQCNGYKILILGNHDIKGNKVKKLDFDEIHLLKHVQVGYGYKTYDFVFVHYPATTFDRNTFVIHGHEHISHLCTNTPQHINVNCELHGFKPINMVSILELARKRRDNIQI